ncbi:hypothetical protein [Kitasatospora sp. McL0602]|uniref:hypothetical protein n=1 Tax=Kitasatospora sp. McL0602 TaxID=3439530 RepID=UPI003F8CC031
MTGTIAAVALGSAAALSCVVYVARQVENAIPVVTSLIKSLIDACQEITDHYRGGRARSEKAIGAPQLPQQLPPADGAELSGRHQHAA